MQVNISNLTLNSIIGKGSRSVVFHARDSKHHLSYAVKRIEKDGWKESDLANEIQIIQSLNGNANIVEFLGSYDTVHYFYLIMEKCQSDLFTAIQEGAYTSEQSIKDVFLDITKAVQYCHDQGVFHRDIKPENILISAVGVAKLSDFGLATSSIASTDYRIGSTRYLSPECIASKESSDSLYDNAPTDIWALGIVLLNLISGKNPWHVASQHDAIYNEFVGCKSDVLQKNLLISIELEEFLKFKVFCIDPQLRCNANEFGQFVTQLIHLRQPKESEIEYNKDAILKEYPVSHSSTETLLNVLQGNLFTI